ncbi:hypothetical protein LF41_3043 [Lysobacter dokdonensis DS-58]|uniref:Transmembrane protein n=1 Tax=Lysobacter dokdonensis DS-58 TaxID=1300345 RepID=A0A0A2WKZ0_9GAMM|nr:hypothetical protein [Lysobacter dokdonensis]KGQ19392.1 hypothetical protein LF41_3043 [Lysobacter dokdonensis DS-58]
MVDSARMQQVHLVLFVFSSAVLAVVGWLEASNAAPSALLPVVGVVPLVHLAIAIGAGKGSAWAQLGSKLTGVYFLARRWRPHSI